MGMEGGREEIILILIHNRGTNEIEGGDESARSSIHPTTNSMFKVKSEESYNELKYHLLTYISSLAHNKLQMYCMSLCFSALLFYLLFFTATV